jgi:hypothetical protein
VVGVDGNALPIHAAAIELIGESVRVVISGDQLRFNNPGARLKSVVSPNCSRRLRRTKSPGK